MLLGFTGYEWILRCFTVLLRSERGCRMKDAAKNKGDVCAIAGVIQRKRRADGGPGVVQLSRTPDEWRGKGKEKEEENAVVVDRKEKNYLKIKPFRQWIMKKKHTQTGRTNGTKRRKRNETCSYQSIRWKFKALNAPKSFWFPTLEMGRKSVDMSHSFSWIGNFNCKLHSNL